MNEPLAAHAPVVKECPRTLEEEYARQIPVRQVIDHLLSTYHQELKRELPRLEWQLDEAVALHATDYPELRTLQDVFRPLAQDLSLHMKKEELVLFPFFLELERGDTVHSFPSGSAHKAFEVMLKEHEASARELERIQELVSRLSKLSRANRMLFYLLHSFAMFDRDLRRHMHLEDSLLFPRVLAVEDRLCALRSGARSGGATSSRGSR